MPRPVTACPSAVLYAVGLGHGEDGQRQAERQRAEQRPAISRRDGERTDETVRPRDGGVYL
ncbi:hypothetical protein CTI14_17410 [Methylobacterium radiotolerans]|nr:hypothetical protein CTI14_17410 [Methylobacterium radiotolerans]